MWYIHTGTRQDKPVHLKTHANPRGIHPVHRFRENFVKETANLVSKVLGDIEGPDDVKKYKERAASEGIDTREPEPSPDGSLASDDDYEITGDSSD